MITQENQMHKAARQSTATETPLQRGNCVHQIDKNWIDELISLYDSVDKYVNRDNAIIKKLGEVRDSQTALELKYLLDHVSKEVRWEFVCKFLAPGILASQPSMTVKVDWTGHTDVKRKNDGRIRLYLIKNGREVPVYFKRRSSIILYLIYLLDVYQSEKADDLDIAKYDTQFCKLFYKVYAYNGGMEKFKTLMGKGNSGQKLLRHSLGDIRQAVGDTCKLLHEPASPYILSGKNSHLCIQKKNIVIDERLLNDI